MAYSDDQKATALAALEANRFDYERTAKYLAHSFKVHVNTLRKWHKGIHVPETLHKNVEEKKRDLADLFEDEIRAALGALDDKREDAAYKDVLTGVGILTDKMQVLRGQPGTINEQRTATTHTERVEALVAILTSGRS